MEARRICFLCPIEKERPPYHSANVMHRNWKSLIPLYTTLLHEEEITVPYSSLVACHNNIFDDMGYKTGFTTSRNNDEDSQRSATLNTSRDVHSEKINDINYNSFLDGEHQRTLRLTFEKVANALHHVFCDVNQVHYHCHHRIRHIGYSSNLKCCCCSRRALHCLKAIHP